MFVSIIRYDEQLKQDKDIISNAHVLQVYSWEPVICHDAVDMGWTTLGDLCIHDGMLLGCSFYSNSVGVWVSDISVGLTITILVNIFISQFIT